jgi:probable HAF family extracellular repeat protein
MLASARGSANGQAEFHGLGYFNDQHPESVAAAVSADGRVVVGFSLARLFNDQADAFRWTAETGMVSIGTLPDADPNGGATDVSDDGNVIVGYSQQEDGPQAFRWTPQTGMEGIGPPPHASFASYAYAVSGDGRVIVGELDEQAFRWTEETDMVYLPVSNKMLYSVGLDVTKDGSVITGLYSNGNGHQASIWFGLQLPLLLGDFPGGNFGSSARGITRDGKIVVGNGITGEGPEGFWWRPEFGMLPIGELEGCDVDSRATAVSDDGQVVVGSSLKICGHQSAARWTPVDGIQDITSLLLQQGATGLEGWILEYASDVSADGTVIVGFGTNPKGWREGWIARVQRPCPADCDLSGVLDLGDWLCFQEHFNAAGPAGDCDAGGTLDLFDYLCFVNQFNAGC